MDSVLKTLGLLLLAASLAGGQGSKLPLMGVGNAAAGGITPPTLISYTETSWVVTGSPRSSASVSWQTGDVIVVIGGQEADITALGNPTATGLTFTTQKSNVAAGSCGSMLATAVAGSTSSSAISMTGPNSVQHWGFGVWVWRGSTGIGNSSEQHTATKTVGLTPTQIHSSIMWGTFDFQPGAAQTITPTPTNTRQNVLDTGRYTIYVSDLGDQPSAGSTSYGITGGAGTGPFSIVVMEVKGT